MSRKLKYLLAIVAVATVASLVFAQQSPFCVTPNVAIPDSPSAGIDNDQVVGASFVLTDLNVTLQINHTWPGDISVTLTKVGGPGPTTIVNRPGMPASTFGCSVDNIDATLDDSAGTSVNVVCNAAPPGVGPGPYQPGTGALNSVFAGTNVNGTWRLHVTDNAGGDTGTLAQWCLVTVPTPVELLDFSIE
jgi:trimeric autotransporter adhesin